MKRRGLILLSILTVLYCASSFAQVGLDGNVTPVFNESQAQELAKTQDMPVDGIGDALFGLYSDLLNAIATLTVGAGDSLTQSFRPTAILIFALYIAFSGYRLINAQVESLKEAATTIVLVMITFGIAFTPGMFKTWILGPLVGTIGDVQTFLVTKATGSASGNIFQSLSTGMDKVMSVTTIIESTVPTLDLVKQLTGLIAQVLLACAFIVVIVAYMLINLMSWATIYLVSVFGGTLTFFAAFKATRHLFWAWVRAICTAGMTLIIASLIMSICLQILMTQIDRLAAQDFSQVNPLFNKATFMCICACALTWCLLMRAPDLAASLTGGSAGNTAGIAGVVSMTAGAAYGGAMWMKKRGASGIGGIAGALGRQGAGGAGGSSSLGGRSASERVNARKGIENP